MACPHAKTVDGFEMQIGTNHLGHFALTMKLLPYMTNQEDARILVLSSSAHRFGFFYLNVNDVNFEKRSYSAMGSYGQAKLANVLFANELQRRLDRSGSGKNISVYSLHPGLIPGTELQRHSTISAIGTYFIYKKSITEGAATTVYCATEPELKGKGGTYYEDCNESNPQSKALDTNTAGQLWTVSETLTKAAFPL
jgi:retinol dehydrogenase-12